MTKLACPHCGQRAMSVWRKLEAGSVWSGKCIGCAGAIGIPAWSLHLWIAIVAVVVAATLIVIPEYWGAMAIALLAFRAVVQLYVLPIERRRPDGSVDASQASSPAQ